MIRLLFFLLLLANAVFLAWSRFGPELAATESFLLGQQINPDAIRLIDARDVATVAAKEPAEKAAAPVCLEWGAFAASDAVKAQALLVAAIAQAKVIERRVEDAAGWWVFMPPQGSRQAATQKAAELKRLGIEQFFIVQDDARFRFALSLGVFRTEEAARAQLEQLRGKGVRTAQVGQRDAQVQRIHLQVRDLPEGASATLAELRQAWPGTEVRECPVVDGRG